MRPCAGKYNQLCHRYLMPTINVFHMLIAILKGSIFIHLRLSVQLSYCMSISDLSSIIKTLNIWFYSNK